MLQLFLHCPREELFCEGPIVAPFVITESVPPTPNPELTLPATPITPSTPSSINPLDEAAVEVSLRERILAYDDEQSDSEETSADESPDANHVYAKLKVQMSEIQRAQGAAKRALKGKGKGASPETLAEEDLREAQVNLLKKKLKVIEGDYTFRKVDAGKIWILSHIFFLFTDLPAYNRAIVSRGERQT